MRRLIVQMLIICLICVADTGTVTAQTTCTIAGKSGGRISVDELIDAKRLTISSSDWKIVSFDLIAPILGENITFPISGAQFDMKVQAVLSSLSVGDKIHFELIKISNGPAIKKLESMHFEISKAKSDGMHEETFEIEE